MQLVPSIFFILNPCSSNIFTSSLNGVDRLLQLISSWLTNIHKLLPNGFLRFLVVLGTVSFTTDSISSWFIFPNRKSFDILNLKWKMSKLTYLYLFALQTKLLRLHHKLPIKNTSSFFEWFFRCKTEKNAHFAKSDWSKKEWVK